MFNSFGIVWFCFLALLHLHNQSMTCKTHLHSKCMTFETPLHSQYMTCETPILVSICH